MGMAMMVIVSSAASSPTAKPAFPRASCTNLGPPSVPADSAYTMSPIASACSIGISLLRMAARIGTSSTLATSARPSRRRFRRGSAICRTVRSSPTLNIDVARKASATIGRVLVSSSCMTMPAPELGCSYAPELYGFPGIHSPPQRGAGGRAFAHRIRNVRRRESGNRRIQRWQRRQLERSRAAQKAPRPGLSGLQLVRPIPAAR